MVNPLLLLLCGYIFGGVQGSLDRALREAQNRQWEQALQSAKEHLQDNNNDDIAHHLVSQILLVQGDLETSLEHIRAAQKIKPSKAYASQVKFHEGAVLQTSDKPAALAAFKESIELLKPQVDERSLEKVAIAAAGLGDLPSAVTYIKQLFKIAPQYQFHNGIPFVRLCDQYDDAVEQAAAKGPEFVESLLQDLSNITRVTDTVYLDVSVHGAPAKRVTIGLFGLAAPKAVHNFIKMSDCSLGQAYCYKGSSFHRVIENFIVQGGDVSPGDGSGRTNVYDRPYGDDVFALTLMHDSPGIVQIANSGPNTNGGQFVILMEAAAHLNGNHVIMGKVLDGFDAVQAINQVEVDSLKNIPKDPVTVVDCGVL